MLGASLVALTVKNPPALQESQEPQKTWVLSLDQKDSLEEGMATHSSILAWRILLNRGAWHKAIHRIAELDKTKQLNNVSLCSAQLLSCV